MRKAVPSHITSKLIKANDGEENGKSGHRKMTFMFSETKIRGEQNCHQRQCKWEDGGATYSDYKHEKAVNLNFYTRCNTFKTEGKTIAERIDHQLTHTIRNLQEIPAAEKQHREK